MTDMLKTIRQFINWFCRRRHKQIDDLLVGWMFVVATAILSWDVLRTMATDVLVIDVAAFVLAVIASAHLLRFVGLLRKVRV